MQSYRMPESTLPRRTRSTVPKYVEAMVRGNLWICQEVGTETIWMVMPIATTAITQQCMDAYMHARTGVHSSNQLEVDMACDRHSTVSVDKVSDVT